MYPVSKWVIMCVSRIDIRQCPVSPVSTLSLSPPPPGHHWSPLHWPGLAPPVWPVITVHVYSLSLQTPASPRPAGPDTFLLSLFTRPLSDGNLKSRKMLSTPAVTATAVKTKGFKKVTSTINSTLIPSIKKETNNNTRGMMMSNI